MGFGTLNHGSIHDGLERQNHNQDHAIKTLSEGEEV